LSRSEVRRPARVALVLLAALIIQMAVPLMTRAASYEVYSLRGYEIWFTQTVGTFVGVGQSSSNQLSGWFTRIEHSPSVSPTGSITGGTATLIRTDGVRMDGIFSTGTVVQTVDGAGCTNESHDVLGSVYGLTSSDRPGQVGVGHFQATLIHYRVWAFGDCYSYSASVNGTFTVAF
jgi:hypothetical protein